METSSAEVSISAAADTPAPLDVENQIQKNSVKKIIICILFLAAIATLSVVIYLNSDKLHFIGNYGLFGVFILCFICNATVLLPAPGLLVVITAATFLNPLLVALTGAAGTTLGEMTGYYSGKAGKKIMNINNKPGKALQKYGSPVIFIFALIPWPLFDIIGVTSGYLGIKLQKFIIACFLGKLIKMVIYAYGFNYFNDVLINMVKIN